MAREIAHDANHDSLTGLANRREFERRIEHALISARYYGSDHVLCYLDLDQFKIVNDTVGHAAGDQVLKEIRGVLSAKIRERDTLARLGGDEFGLLFDNCPLEIAIEISQSLVTAVHNHRFVWEGKVFQLGVSVGLVAINATAESVAKLLSQADVACYTAKEFGRNQLHVYHEIDSEPTRRHSEILRAAELRDAIERDQFRLHYQPIVALDAAMAGGNRYELLLRLVGQDGGLILPDQFIPPAERFGLMGAIDRWVVRTAFRRYIDIFGSQSDTNITVNLSGNSLTDDSLSAFVHRQFSESGVPPQCVCFEITETAAVHNLHHAHRFVASARRLGCQLALDDFGSGLSSFAYLKNLKVDYLKIDGSFVRNIADDHVDLGMVAAINEVGHIMRTKTVAEYAHSKPVVDKLRELGVDYAQGFYLGRPAAFEGNVHCTPPLH